VNQATSWPLLRRLNCERIGESEGKMNSRGNGGRSLGGQVHIVVGKNTSLSSKGGLCTCR